MISYKSWIFDRPVDRFSEKTTESSIEQSTEHITELSICEFEYNLDNKTEFRMVQRSEWNAMPVDHEQLDFLMIPTERIIIGHTFTNSCSSQVKRVSFILSKFFY